MTQINNCFGFLVFRKRPSVKDLLEHPWLTCKASILPPLQIKSRSETGTVTPKSTPYAQRKSLTCLTETPKSQRKNFCSDTLNGSYTDCTYSVSPFGDSPNCLCPQCGPTCRRLTHAPVSKTPITVDRGILC